MQSVVLIQNGDDNTVDSNSGNADRKACIMCGINSEKEITRRSVIYMREMKDSEWTTV